MESHCPGRKAHRFCSKLAWKEALQAETSCCLDPAGACSWCSFQVSSHLSAMRSSGWSTDAVIFVDQQPGAALSCGMTSLAARTLTFVSLQHVSLSACCAHLVSDLPSKSFSCFSRACLLNNLQQVKPKLNTRFQTNLPCHTGFEATEDKST